MRDDYTDPEQLNVVIEYQFGDAESWHHTPYFEDMRNLGGGAYDFTFGPYFLDVDFRIRFTVRVTDADGAVAQLPERTIDVRNCPLPPPPNEPPTVRWVDSGNLQALDSTVGGYSCTQNDLPDTKTLIASVGDDTTPPGKLKVELVFIYGEYYGEGGVKWLPELAGLVAMTYAGNDQYTFVAGPYSATIPYVVAYYVLVTDPDGATASTELAMMVIYGCVQLVVPESGALVPDPEPIR
jgi:hypothetical protein